MFFSYAKKKNTIINPIHDRQEFADWYLLYSRYFSHTLTLFYPVALIFPFTHLTIFGSPRMCSVSFSHFFLFLNLFS